MGELQPWLTNSFDPTDPDTLLWQVTGGNYRLVKDPVRYLPAFRQAIMSLPDSLTRRCIRRARILAGVCPICMAELPLQKSRARRRALGPHVWDCSACGWFHVQTEDELKNLLAEPGIAGLESDVAEGQPPETVGEHIRAIAEDFVHELGAGLVRAVSTILTLLPFAVAFHLILRAFGFEFLRPF